MRWISATDLENWARSLPSEAELPKIVSDLIRASGADLASFRFPSGDKGRVRGFDGHLVANSGALNVPAGRSFWEFGTNEKYKAKALEDYDKRTGEVDAATKADTTYVFVSPWTWDSSNSKNKIEDWISARRKDGGWKDVAYVDGTALEAWLDANPAVAAWHARNTLSSKPVADLRSSDEFWADFSGRCGPPFTEEVLLCERDESAKQLMSQLLGSPATITMVGDTVDEVVAFAISAIRKAEPEARLFLEARGLVVDSAAAGRQLLGHRNLILFLRGDAARSPAQFSAAGTIIVPLGRQPPGGRIPELPRPTGQAMGMAMKTMGFGEQEALTLARGSGRSLTALARLKPGGTFEPPAWVGHGRLLLASILAGAWDASNELDRGIVEQIAGRPGEYDAIEADLRQFRGRSDPPFDLEGAVWAVRAPMDAFIQIGPLIGPAEAERLRVAMVTVFGTIQPEDDTEGFVSSWEPRAPRYSEWLREGLATTLLLMAVWSEPAGVNLRGQSGQRFADQILEALPGLRNDERLLRSLRRELPQLAEAAPSPLLSALELMLEGAGGLIRPIFEEKEGLLFPRSYHTGLLWALETLAWDPTYFRRAVHVLAKLTAIDPGGKLTNRPLSSLAEIFLLWNPNTNAAAPLRLAVLGEIVSQDSPVGWELVARLLPTMHGSSVPTAKPRLREAGAAERPAVTYRALEEMQGAVIDMAFDLAGSEPSRWDRLVRGYSLFPPAQRSRLVGDLDRVLGMLERSEQEALWTSLRDEVARHQRFASAAWAMRPDDLAPLVELVERYAPLDPLGPVIYLFDNWSLDGTGDLKASNSRRAQAMGELAQAQGVHGVYELAVRTKLPFLVAEAAEEANLDASFVESLLEMAFRADKTGRLTLIFLSLQKQLAGEQAALRWLENKLVGGQLNEAEAGTLLLAFPFERTSWATARSFGPDAVESYWRQVGAHRISGPTSDVARASLMLLRFGRATILLQALNDRLADVPSKLLLRALDGVVTELNSGTVQPDTMLNFYLEQTLQSLDGRPDVDELALAQREYTFLPLLEYSGRSLLIHKMMARDADFYHSILRDVFLEKGAEKGEVDKATEGKARLGYSLLSHFDQLPGADDAAIDEAALTAWIDRVRALGRETNRAEITDSYVGRVLAHGPIDPDGAWPHRAVRRQIERLASDDIDRAIQIERFNMRGVHSRGVYDGGDQERALAAATRAWAEVAAQWPRTASLLDAVAKGWEADAERADLQAAHRRLRS